MAHIDLPEPRPRSTPLSHQAFFPQASSVEYLDVPASMPERIFWEVLTNRASRRLFGRLSDDKLSSLLWYSAKIQNTSSANQRLWQHRPTPSAGGLHPISILVQSNETASWYDPNAHALRLTTLGNKPLAATLDYANSVLNTGAGTLLWLVGDFNLTRAYYSDADSLVWRDAGAMIGTIGLIAEALGQNCCALGITGDAVLKGLLNLPDGVHGVGAMVVGSRSQAGTV